MCLQPVVGLTLTSPTTTTTGTTTSGSLCSHPTLFAQHSLSSEQVKASGKCVRGTLDFIDSEMETVEGEGSFQPRFEMETALDTIKAPQGNPGLETCSAPLLQASRWLLEHSRASLILFLEEKPGLLDCLARKEKSGPREAVTDSGLPSLPTGWAAQVVWSSHFIAPSEANSEPIIQR